MMHGAKPDAGFTYFELMVSLALMGIMAVYLASTMEFGRKVWERGKKGDIFIEAALARHSLKTWMDEMPEPGMPGSVKQLLKGSRTKLRFETFVPGGASTALQVVFVTIGESAHADRKALIISKSDMSNEKNAALAKTRSIADDIVRIKISYYGQTPGGPLRTWRADWNNPNFLPDLIKIEAWKDGGSAIPPLVLQPAKNARQRFMSLSSLVPPT